MKIRVLSMVCAIVALTVSAAGAAHGPAEHLEGTDTVGQAIAWSQHTSPDWRTREEIVLGRADAFADSLASGLLQGALDAPLLLTPREELDARVTDELERLEAGKVHLLGGTAAISAEVEQQLRDAGYEVVRHAGATRIQTALAVSRAHATFNEGAEREAVLARAFGEGSAGFADALGAGALAAQWALPLLLTPTESLDGDVAAYLDEQQIDRVYLAGGTAALSAQIEQQLRDLGIEVVRVSGADRAATAVAMNGPRRISEGDAVILTEGYTDDAWAAGFSAALAATMFFESECADPDPLPGCGTGGPDWKAVVLSNGHSLPVATSEYLESLPDDTRLICSASVSTEACDAALMTIHDAA